VNTENVQKNNPLIPVIFGPTAAGKTALAVRLAQIVGGEIISADSIQVYKELDIGAAKPSAEELAAVRHHLVSVVECDKEFSVGEYRVLADSAIADVVSRGNVPIICGGTGLYMQALLYGYEFAQTPRSEKTRLKYKELLEREGKESLHSLLVRLDGATAAKIHPNDTKRVIRALEIIYCSGQKKSDNIQTVKRLKYPVFIIGLDPPRDEVYERINLRVIKMFERGLLAEVKSLLTHIPPTAQSMQAIGYKETAAYFNGLLGYDELVALVQKNSRNYAKRQMTFFRGQFEDIHWVGSMDEAERLLSCHCERQRSNQE